MDFKTEQEEFWAGEFGNDYVERNNNPTGIARRTALFSKIFSRAMKINSVLEFGSNIGYNLKAIRNILPNTDVSAIELNTKAIQVLKAGIHDATVYEGSILDFDSKDLGMHDLTFTAGVLIHINPQKLPEVYAKLYECSNRYIMIREYYSTKPVEIDYRGNANRLFKRDFAGELMNLYPELELVDYGFQYHRDYNFPMDDATWFLLRKTS